MAFGLLFILLIINILRPRPAPPPPVIAPMVEKKIEVVIARQSIETGQSLDKANLVLEQRPISTLPADAVTSFAVLKSKVAAGPIPAGYPLAQALLADPVQVVPAQEEPIEQEDPFDSLLKEIEKDTVALSLSLPAGAPPRGARIAITITKPGGDPVIVVEDCWVAQSNSKDAVLRLEASQALLLQSARSYGGFGYIELPLEGPSPYAGKGVRSMSELRDLIEGKKNPVQVAGKRMEESPKMKGYAWVSGEEGVRYGIDDQGTIRIVNSE